jgi:ABC-type antimicrobial peptide transport system permease subunit
LILAGLGLGFGILMALGLGRFLASQLFGVEPWDPATLAGAGLLLLGATLVASYLPARRAAGLDAVEVLRRE